MRKNPYTYPHRSRKAMLEYLGQHESYWPMNSWNRGFVLAWNVKIYHLDSSGKAAPQDYPVQDRFDEAWETYCNDNDHLFWDACRDAASFYLEGLWTNPPGIEQGDWEFFMNGRSGGYMILEDAPAWLPKPRGWTCCKMTWEDRSDYQEWLHNLDTPTLKQFYRAIRALDHDLRQEAAEQEVAYHIAAYRHGWEQDLIASENCDVDKQEQERPDLYEIGR